MYNAERLQEELSGMGLLIGIDVRQRINEIPRYQRGDLTTTVLKPYLGAKSKLADAEGERVGFDRLKSLSRSLEKRIKVIVDPKEGKVLEIGDYKDSESIYSYFDAVDGTMKVAGLGNEPENNIYRVGNNGSFATGIAFTMPTRKDLSELRIKDFEIAAVVDGNPMRHRSSPTNAVVNRGAFGLHTYEFDESIRRFSQLHTSSQTNLSQATVLYDAFQAFDRNSAKSGDEELAARIFPRLMNRNSGGAFDIVRMYGNIGEIVKQCLERYEGNIKYEPQSAGSIVINENLPNLVPIEPIMRNAGGSVIDFDGNPIGEKRLKDGRQNVITAANPTIQESLMKIVKA